MIVRIVLLILALTIGLVGGRAMAQEPVADLLPAADDVGDGWVEIGRTGYLEMVPERMGSFVADAAVSVFGGPHGARLSIYIYRTGGSPSAIRKSWDATNQFFESMRGKIDYEYDSSRETELEAAPLPAGCADARRTYGEESTSPRFKIGLTLCAADPNLIILVFTSGEINGVAGQSAADSIVEPVLSADEEPAP